MARRPARTLAHIGVMWHKSSGNCRVTCSAEVHRTENKRSMTSGPPHQAKAARQRPSRRPSLARFAARGVVDFPVVGIGASAGGLDACTRLVDALPAGSGMVFILVQHLDPTHESMMVDLLAGHTSMSARQATDGMLIERDFFYVIPPGTYLSIASGVLQVSQPQARHGTRLPFDFLLRSLAEECGPRAIGVILSGTGADGSLGLKMVKENGGLVIAQDPDEAEFDAMPRNAIMTGSVDLVLPVAKIPGALVKYARRMARAPQQDRSAPPDKASDWLSDTIDLLRAQTRHDFALYKPDTLRRRIERRAAMAAFETAEMDRYLDFLRSDPGEIELLAKDLLINVTRFFRDRKVFDLLEKKIVPDLVRGHAPDQPLRIWIAGCSSGEETYSFTMLFREAIAAEKVTLKLQVFASDVDPDAVASAREGLYPESIEADVSAARLTRFFVRAGDGYRVCPDLRSAVVFTVHDVLADPPFSQLDLVSCRNLMIYLRPEAQVKVVSLFHFALRQGGILVLGAAETPGSVDGRFEVISKAERVYRHIGPSRPGGFGFLIGDGSRALVPAGLGSTPTRPIDLGDLGRRLLVEAYTPPAIFINHKRECLFSFGPTHRYLHLGPGAPATTCSPWCTRKCGPTSVRPFSRPSKRTCASPRMAAGLSTMVTSFRSGWRFNPSRAPVNRCCWSVLSTRRKRSGRDGDRIHGDPNRAWPSLSESSGPLAPSCKRRSMI